MITISLTVVVTAVSIETAAVAVNEGCPKANGNESDYKQRTNGEKS